jgi:hypothetical protein
MPGFATRKMSARPSDRFRFRIPHQSILCVDSKKESFLVLSTDGLFCWTNHRRISVGGVPSFGPNPPPFPTFFTTYHPIVHPLLHSLRNKQTDAGQPGRNTEEQSRTKEITTVTSPLFFCPINVHRYSSIIPRSVSIFLF